MFLSPPSPSLLAAALPITPGIFMVVVVISACAYGVIAVFNYLSLKTKSTNRLSVAAVVLLIAGLLMAEASIGRTFDSDAPPLLSGIPGEIALGLLVLAALTGVIGFIHCYLHRQRYRRGRKRALGTLVFSLIAIGGFYYLSSSAKNPRIHVTPKSKVELLPETDAYGRPLATPEPVPATPPPATPAPLATPVRIATPARIATPEPPRLLPNVITLDPAR